MSPTLPYPQRHNSEDQALREAAQQAKEEIQAKYESADRRKDSLCRHELNLAWDCLGKPTSCEAIADAFKEAKVAREYFWEKQRILNGRSRVSRRLMDGRTVCDSLTVGVGPIYSAGLALAVIDGRGEVVRAFLNALAGSALIPECVKAFRGAVVFGYAVHPSLWSLHMEVYYSLWSAPEPHPLCRKPHVLACNPVGGSHAPNRMFCVFSAPLIGVMYQAALGLPVDLLTGCRDSLAKARFFLNDATRFQEPINLEIMQRMQRWIGWKIRQPEWAALLPYMRRADAEYRCRKLEQAGIVSARLSGRCASE